MSRRFGFTLVELLVAIIIIGLLAAIAIPVVVDAKARSDQSAIAGQVHVLGVAVEAYHADTGLWPRTLNDLTVTTAPPTGTNDLGRSMPLIPSTYRGPYITDNPAPGKYVGLIGYNPGPPGFVFYNKFNSSGANGITGG